MLPLSPPPHARFDSECKRWNLEHVVLDQFSHIKTGKIKWYLLQSSLSLVVTQASAICSNCLHRLPNCLLSVMIMCTTVSEEAAASDILVGAQPRIRCWARTRSSSSELVDTATARRQQRVEDAARVGLQFPYRSERRGRGASSVAMKWRDAVKAAIMHGPLPPDVTLDAPHWWQPGMPLLPPAWYVSPVPLKRKRDTSAEPKRDPTKRAYMRMPDEAKLWFVDFHAY